MVSRSEVDMLDIRQEYLKNYGKSLYTAISVSIHYDTKALYPLKSVFKRPMFNFLGLCWTGRHIRRLQETPTQALRGQWLKKGDVLSTSLQMLLQIWSFWVICMHYTHTAYLHAMSMLSMQNLPSFEKLIHIVAFLCKTCFIYIFCLYYIGRIWQYMDLQNRFVRVYIGFWRAIYIYILKDFFFYCANMIRYWTASDV